MGKLLTELILLPSLITSMALSQYVVHIVLHNSQIKHWLQVGIVLLTFALQELVILNYSYDELGTFVYPYTMAVSIMFISNYHNWDYICGSIIITAILFNGFLYIDNLNYPQQPFYIIVRLTILLGLEALLCHHPRWQSHLLYTIVLVITNMWVDVWQRPHLAYGPLPLLGGSLIFVIITIWARYIYQLYRKRSAEIAYQNTHDKLTGLLNYRSFSNLVERLREEGSQRRVKFGVVDIDHFKAVNDQYGHLAGNTLLKAFAEFLLQNLMAKFSSQVSVYRFGGEEFCVVFYRISANECKQAMLEMEKRISHHRFTVDGGQWVTISFSCGIAHSEDDPHLTLRRADTELYRAKSQGRAQICTNFN